jgi:hypothetical protein
MGAAAAVADGVAHGFLRRLQAVRRFGWRKALSR